MIFQSTLPREERHRYNLKCLMFEDYFNPRSHERSDCCHLITAQLFIISIHAPTRGATSAKFPVNVYVEVISIHAPTRGATATHWQPRGNHHQFQSTLPREERRLWLWFCTAATYFNPRSHERSDQLVCNSSFHPISISIHAPTRGATSCLLSAIACIWYFNPRSHERSDQSLETQTLLIAHFNPRSHERSDLCVFHFKL